MTSARTIAPAATAVFLLLAAAVACPAATSAAAPTDTITCPNPAGPVAVGTAQWDGWGREIDNSRYQPEPAIRASDVPRLRFKWAYSYAAAAAAGPAGNAAPTSNAAPTPNAAPTVDAQPTVVDGRLFAASAAGRITALDAVTGCTYWTFDAAAGTRTALVVGELAPPKRSSGLKKFKHKKKDAHIEVEKPPSAVFFGDDSGAVYALDAQNGRLIWKIHADGRPLPRAKRKQPQIRDTPAARFAAASWRSTSLRGARFGKLT